MNGTLGELLSVPAIAPIAPDAIRNRDLSGEEIWGKTLTEIHAEFFTGQIGKGLERLYAAADTKEWYYPLYTEKECEEDPARRGTNIVRLPSGSAGADERPFILLVPGGGFVNVWNLTEGWPVAAQFNELGYHVFILTYQVEGENGLLRKNMDDFARALGLIRKNAADFHVNAEKYITCGFSAGGYLICLWNTEAGYAAYGMPKPRASIPVYPVVSIREQIHYKAGDATRSVRLYGCDLETASRTVYEIPEHTDGFPPCAVFLAAGDELVSPEHSRMLAAALEKRGIPCLLEIGLTGGHGFADGSGMCMEGWTERAVRWVEQLPEES